MYVGWLPVKRRSCNERSSLDIAVGPDLIRGGYPMQWYVLFFLYVCMYVCMTVFIMVVVNKYLFIHTYRRAPHCDGEIDGGERDDKRWMEDGTASLHGGYTTMYVCKLVNGKV